jgi:hypothetical protein
MELSGDLWERPVTVGQGTKGRAFTGLHGDGKLTADGEADAAALNWPLGTDALGAGYRGGGWSTASDYARVSGRNIAAHVNASRHSTFGWRGVRVAP